MCVCARYFCVNITLHNIHNIVCRFCLCSMTLGSSKQNLPKWCLRPALSWAAKSKMKRSVPEQMQTWEVLPLEKDNPSLSHILTRAERRAPRPQTSITTRASRSTDTRYNLPAKATPKVYSDFLIHHNSDARATLRLVSTRGKGIQTQPS